MKNIYVLLIIYIFPNTHFCPAYSQKVHVDSSKLDAEFQSIHDVFTREKTKSQAAALRDSSFMSAMKKSSGKEFDYHDQYYDYLGESLAHRQKMFNWQYNSQIAIFILVLIIVVTGIFFSWIQFKKGMLTNTLEKNLDEKGGMSVTNVELSFQSIKISSSFVGLIILIISLAFFYLYLVHVYPIKEIGDSIKTP